LTKQDRAHLAAVGRPQIAGQPAGTYAKQILNRLLIDLAWNSSRLEGNTYSLLDTKRLIELGEEAKGRAHLEAQMILNHKDAIEFLVGAADEIGFNRYTILNLHAILANNLLADPTAAGRLRYIAVGIERSAFHPLEVPQLIEESFDQILATAAAIRDPFEQAFFVMVQLPYLQPFDDVNKRLSRLAANIPLIKRNLTPSTSPKSLKPSSSACTTAISPVTESVLRNLQPGARCGRPDEREVARLKCLPLATRFGSTSSNLKTLTPAQPHHCADRYQPYLPRLITRYVKKRLIRLGVQLHIVLNSPAALTMIGKAVPRCHQTKIRPATQLLLQGVIDFPDLTDSELLERLT
jgi:hypothetical protein